MLAVYPLFIEGRFIGNAVAVLHHLHTDLLTVSPGNASD